MTDEAASGIGQSADAAEDAADFDVLWDQAFGEGEWQQAGQELLQDGQEADAIEGEGQEVAGSQPLQDPEVVAEEDGEAEDGVEVREDEDGDVGGAGDAEAEEEEPAADDVDAAAGPSALDQQAVLRNERLLASLSEAQLDRYEAYRRSKLPAAKMKKLLQQLFGVQQVSDKLLIAMCGIGKLFVGDLIELARHQASTEGYEGPLLPRHVLRAYQMLAASERMPVPSGTRKRLFRG